MLALFLVVLMSINSFGAVVSDNDGSAFITKAEFDSLKNDFQRQIDQYNTSIDSKIDGAIASYLAGVSLSSSRPVPVLIRNYEQLKWQKSWKLWGKFKEWTDRTTIGLQVSSDWFTPGADRRLTWRDDNFEIFDKLQHSFGAFSLFLKGDITAVERGFLLIRNSPHGQSGQQQTSPLFVIKYIWDEASNQYKINETEPFWNIFSLNYHINTYIHKPIAGAALWQYADLALPLDADAEHPIQAIDDDTAVWNWYINVKRVNGDTLQWQDRVTAKEISFPTIVSSYTPYEDHGYAASPYAHNYRPAYEDPDLYNIYKCSWSFPSKTYETQLNDAFLNLALGENNDQIVNIFKLQHEYVNGEAQIVTHPTETANFEGNMTAAILKNLKWKDSDAVTRVTLNEPFSINVPLFPQCYVRDIELNNYDYNNQNLKAGAGLPLYEDSDGNYNLQISFDYGVYDILTDEDLTKNYNLAIDLKKGDFLDQSDDASDFFDAYDGFDDDPSSTSAVHKYKKYVYPTNASDSTIRITVPIKKDDDVWLRVCPNTDTVGIYAKLRNLKLTLVS